MPGKKGGKKSGGGADKAACNLITHDRPPITPADVKRISDRWVNVELKLVTWTYLNFSIRVPSSTNLYIIEQRIKEQHCGSITKLQMWKTQVHPKNVLKDFSRTLAQEFRLDESVDDDTKQEDECVMFYDFHPHESDCPLLLRSPRHRDESGLAGIGSAGAQGGAPGAGKQQGNRT